MGLKEQIEAWLEAMKAACMRVAEAEAGLNELALELRLVRERQRDLEGSVVSTSWQTRPTRSMEQYGTDMTQRSELRQRYAEAEERSRFAGDDLVRAKAAADVELRKESEQAGKKVTEGALKALIQLHPDVVAAEQRWRDAQAQARAIRMEPLTSVREPFVAPAAPVNEPEEDAFNKAEAALTKEVVALKRRRVALLRQLEVARADIAYQRAVGKSLTLLAELAAAETRAMR